MGKEHLDKKKNHIPLPHYKGYYIDKVYRKICYKNNKGEWLYCKKVDNKPGFVYLYSGGVQVSINEISIIHGILGDKPKMEKPKEEREKDKRYKGNADSGAMTKQTVGLIIKNEPIIKKEYDDTPKQYIRLKQARRKR